MLKKSLFLKIITVCIVCFVVISLIPTTLELLWGDDIAPIDDRDLTLPVVTLADEDNMFLVLDTIKREMIHEPEDVDFTELFLNSENWSVDYANAVFSQNKNVLEIWQQAAQKNEYLEPQMADPAQYSIDMPIIDNGRFRVVNRLVLAHAVWLAHTGETQTAIDQVMQSIKIGDAMMKAQGHMLGYLVGMSIKDSGLDALQKVIKLSDGNSFSTQKLLSTISSYATIQANDSIFIGEYLIHKKVYAAYPNYLYNSGTKIYFSERILVNNDFYYKPNLTILYAAEKTRYLINALKEPCKKQGLFALPPQNKSVWGMFFTENSMGKLLEGSSMVAFNAVERTCELQVKQEETMQMIKSL